MTTKPEPAPLPPPPAVARRFLARLALLALIWLGLNGADWSSWMVGGPVVVVAAWISVKLLPTIPWHWSMLGAIAFAGFFLRESVRGGWEVARRAISPGLAISPAIVCHSFHLPPGPSRLFFCTAISLLPGTAVVAMADSKVCVHALDHSRAVEEELRELERRVGTLFGVELLRERESAA